MNTQADDDTKSQAYLTHSEWGPSRMIPREERLAGLFPNLTGEEIAAWIADFNGIENDIWEFAEKGGPREWSYADFEKHMLGHFPFMNEPALQRAWFLCGYYTWHEGY